MAYQSAYSASEQQVQRYIAACGENGAATVADVMLDQWFGHLDAAAKSRIRIEIISVLTVELSRLEIAGAASAAVGGPSYEEWCEEQGAVE